MTYGLETRYRRRGTSSQQVPSTVLPRAAADTTPNYQTTANVCNVSVDLDRDAHIEDSPEEDALILHDDTFPLTSLPDDVLKILGTDPKQEQATAASIHEQLATRWGAILVNGLKKVNQHLSWSYKLPLDIKEQILTGLSDAGRIHANLFHRVSVIRKNLIVPCLKNMKDLADTSVPAEFLFGQDLAEKLNSVKALESVSKELKLPSARPPRRLQLNRSLSQHQPPFYKAKNLVEHNQMQAEINHLLQLDAVRVCKAHPDQFLSNIFLASKPNGKKRFIFNLKSLNIRIYAPHFKMEDERTASKIQHGNYAATIDLKDAYYLVPIHKDDRKYLRFYFNGTCYEFTCVAFGLASAPFMFTKLMKPIVRCLRDRDVLCVNYLDDFLILGQTKEICESHLRIATTLLTSLGLLINTEKSVLSPNTRCKFLGFIFDSNTMSIELPPEKREKILLTSKNDLRRDVYDLEICTDASLSGWGACCRDDSVHGWWSLSESSNHINFLELQATFFGLQCFANNLQNCNILIRTDNTTALANVNRMGSVKHQLLNSLTRNIWHWAEERNIWIFASYISSSENWQADQASRVLQTETEWSLDDQVFLHITQSFGSPDIDIFASRNNHKCARYISWLKDPGAEAVDAFTIDWGNIFFYAFPPFSQILRTLQKIKNDKAEGILVVPYWKSQSWYPLFNTSTIDEPLQFGPSVNLVLCPFSGKKHPLHTNLILVAARLSGKHSDEKVSLRKPLEQC
ncbi:hypothetical protein NQ315_017427 [Exocentrus adspersus]|uniref:Reverse transcriptase domain-containing protein n=1 Tax=Exocentrus adspersus TaxID=1586481 RepID=A0AAV8VK28_9CUCU|nr:hypothetical protein NQ315_017427 [Exocentrus adspersus]